MSSLFFSHYVRRTVRHSISRQRVSKSRSLFSPTRSSRPLQFLPQAEIARAEEARSGSGAAPSRYNHARALNRRPGDPPSSVFVVADRENARQIKRAPAPGPENQHWNSQSHRAEFVRLHHLGATSQRRHLLFLRRRIFDAWKRRTLEGERQRLRTVAESLQHWNSFLNEQNTDLLLRERG